MFRHILVPLDGSRAAESALPAAAYLARKLRATVTLLHVLERGAPAEVHGQPHLRAVDEAERYLSGVRARCFSADTRVKVHVHTEEVRDAVAGVSEHDRELEPDLVILCAHGRGGLRRALFGSVAQRLVLRTHMAVLAMHPSPVGRRPGTSRPAAGEAAFRCRTLLVPLDERAEHERALEVSRRLAVACGAEVALLTVVPTLASARWRTALTGRLLPGTTARMLEMSVEAAAGSLDARKEKLQGEGVTAAALVLRGDPSRLITRTAERLPADLLIMETHGRSGLEALWAGSVASRVFSRCRAPVLLVPAPR